MELIAELGINHNGDLKLAKEMILAAYNVGATCVKFQKRCPDICVPNDQKGILRETPWGVMTYLNYKKRIEFEKKEYNEINRYCNSLGIDWSASAWDIPSLEFLLAYEIPFIKIASASLTSDPLLEKIADSGVPVILSTGMSTEAEISHAVNILTGCDLTLMHCVSGYPTANIDLNLNKIKTLHNQYPRNRIGYSGHEIGYLPTLIARSMGAEVIERHFTIDRTLWGSDQSISLLPSEFKIMADLLKEIPDMLGTGKMEVMCSELNCLKKLRGI
ncbi:N-acetylneuraminate synthase family protein [Bacteroides sp.]|uniref:N-acetylneuraminate synthase family protein n=1 Tax=Bacteroides sp. TaxID=29523 RepID=UPI0026131124|nr:N-acetylneuraminate synthase family protein [Bacteroides sp.]MDD3039595.1 N-acetylneuraminate synthase family protein [Bacteroides sp.]